MRRIRQPARRQRTTQRDQLVEPRERAGSVLEPTRPTAFRIERSRLLRDAGLSDLADAELRYGARGDGQPQLLGMAQDGARQVLLVIPPPQVTNRLKT